MAVTRILTLDLSTRDVGWACSNGTPIPAYGLLAFPGMKDLGKLYAACRNSVEKLIETHDPEMLVFCLALFRDQQTAARALAGVQAVTELCAYDCGIEVMEASEMQARKAILGRGTFAVRNPRYPGPTPDGKRPEKMWMDGSKNAKLAVMKWCADQGYDPATHDVGDALVLLRFAQQQTAKPKKQWGTIF
jgi:RNase H-fold protein (predicted Holliday junction resolvase)